MKKSELIKLLTDIKGNPEITLWNGYVGDWMPIDKTLVELELVKESSEHIRRSINNERFCDGLSPISDAELLKNIKNNHSAWILPNEFVPEDEMNEWYGKSRKKILVLQPKLRGKSVFDRNGNIEY